MKNVTAVILGGGRGARLFPLTLKRSKPAVNFMGKFRLIDIPISNCINSGVKKVFVLTQFLSASLHRHIMQTYMFDTFTDGFVDILAAEQTPAKSDWYQGTADAVRATLHHTTYYSAQQLLVLSGDHLYRMDYADLIAFHREQKADVTLCVYPVSRDEALRMGLMRVDGKGAVEEFVEKPSDPQIIDRFEAPTSLFESRGLDCKPNQYLASMGIYVFEPHILEKLLTDESKTDFGNEIIPSAIGKCRVVAYPFVDYWRDIGTISSFYEANIELAQHEPSFPIYQRGWPIYTRTRSLPPSRIIESEIRDCLVVEGADITGASIFDSILGMRSNVNKGSVLKGVVMMGADFYEGDQLLGNRDEGHDDVPGIGVGRDCHIERTIIDKNARIGDGVVIRARPDAADEEQEGWWVRDGITIIPRGAIVPSGTVI